MMKKAGAMVRAARHIVVFTGAGISTESGIPDFRSPGGLWSQYDPEEFTFQRFLSSEKARQAYWRMSTEFYKMLKNVQPNSGHFAVSELEKQGKLDAVITQNIDGLHQMAGTSVDLVIELHGTARHVSCLSCQKRYDRDALQLLIGEDTPAPVCDDCQGLLKPATISFGQSMPKVEMEKAYVASENCDLFIVVGSSLVVQPAASLPLIAKQAGASLVIINREETPIDSLADAVIHRSCGETMAEIVQT